MKKFIILISILFLSGMALRSQQTFQKIITKNRYEIAKSVVQTLDGGYAFLADIGSGMSSGKWIVKTNANGDTLWTRTFQNYGYGFFRDRELVQTSDGGFSFLLDRTDSTYILHLSQEGDSLWARAVGPLMDHVLAPVSDKDYLVADIYMAGNTGLIGINRFDSLGVKRWSKMFSLRGLSDGSSAVAYSICEVPGNGFILAGGLYSMYFTFTPFLFRLGEEGDSLWCRKYSPYGDARFISVDIIGDQGFYAGGIECIGRCNTLLMKLDPAGDTVWAREQYLAGNQSIYSLRTTAGGDVIVCGEYSRSSWSQDTAKLMLRRYGRNGDILWEKLIGNYCQSPGFSLEYTADSGLIVCGGVQDNQGEDYHAMLVRTDRNGNIFGTGFTDLSEPAISCWPNPASEILYIGFSRPVQVACIEITDITGLTRLNTNVSMETGTCGINIEALPDGLYLLKCRTGVSKPVIRKFLVKRDR